MTTGLFWISYAAVWVLLLAVSGGLLVLFRFSMRAYRMQTQSEGADDRVKNGPELNASAPALELQDMAGDVVSLGRPRSAAQLILFAKSTCARCRTAIELLRPFTSEHPGLETIVVCGGSREVIADCASMVGSPLKAVADIEGKGAAAWGVSRMPFGVVLDSSGVVRSRGDPTETALLTIVGKVLERSHEAAGQRTNVTESSSLAHL
jgi:hypothetical protein